MPGITGVVRDGILPGLYGYEAGQTAVGDMLAWFVDTLAPDRGYEGLEQAAAGIAPGATGLVSLDWWNGNRTILADADLTGAIFGLAMQSTPEQIYRALMESIAFGNRRILENFEEHGLSLNEIVACGGIAEKSPLMMQLLAITLRYRPVREPPRIVRYPAPGSARRPRPPSSAWPCCSARSVPEGYRVRWRARGSIAVGGPRPQLELELVGLVLAVAVGQLARAGGGDSVRWRGCSSWWPRPYPA